MQYSPEAHASAPAATTCSARECAKPATTDAPAARQQEATTVSPASPMPYFRPEELVFATVDSPSMSTPETVSCQVVPQLVSPALAVLPPTA